MIKAKMNLTIPFYDIDPMNIVWHGNYVKYMEMARCNFFKEINYTYTDMYNDGFMFPVAKMELKYIKSATFGQNVTIECELVEVEPALIFKYLIYDTETKEKICKATTMQIGVDIKTKDSLYEIPEKMRKKIDEYKK